MATIPSFSIKDTDADAGAISGAADNFYDIAGRVTGQGSTVRDLINGGAREFSTIIAEPIKGQAQKNMMAWLAATQGSVYGAAVTAAWGKNVAEFKRRRDALLAAWSAATSSDFGLTMPRSVGGDGAARDWELYDQKLQTAADKKFGEVTAEATALWRWFESEAGARGRELKAGPTKETLKELAEAGTLGWAGFNLFGGMSPTPLTEAEAQKLAEQLAARIMGGVPLTPEDLQNLRNIQALVTHAQWLQGNGGQLSAGELKFLEKYYGTLGLIPTKVEDYLKNAGQFMKPEDRDLLRATLGGGLLALSSEDLGGGYDKLPAPLRDLINHSTPIVGNDPGASWAPVAALAPLLLAGGKQIIGGKEFSGRMTFFVADQLHPLKGKDLEAARQLLEVSLNNKWANGEILSGKFTDFGDKDGRERVIREIFGKEWGDDGATAAKLVDWIPDAAGSKDQALKDLAGGASAGLWDTLTNTKPGAYKTSAFEWVTDGFGKAGKDPAAPLGVVNPIIAQKLGAAVVPYLTDTFTEDPEGLKNGYDPKSGLHLDEDTRRRAFQIIMGDEKAADALGGTVFALAGDDLRNLTHWDGADGEHAGAKAGRLTGYLDSGLQGLINDREAGVEPPPAASTKTDDRIVRWGNLAASITKEVVTSLPGFKTVSNVGQIFWKIGFEGAKNLPGTTNMEGWWSTVDMPGNGGHDSGEQGLPGPVRLGTTQLLFRDAAVRAIIDDPRMGVSVDDLPPSLRDGDHVKSINDIPAGAARDQAREDMLRIIKQHPNAADAYAEFEKSYLAWKGDASGKDYAGGNPKG
ncbi:hypothetical protein Afil01_13000 [Actinorhabdospora filicis]|uniref:TPR repeat domain-containing protein n=1 Tax=Actinorhabdospora filicis TaxID=1785913 RepID=A0A9W6W812_9ACTN|nr:hypothetical protein [Actinorhabdospora filicis]GLZ76493.1 hypothetical protein Afil01_13000 [Actinorhabdospora filicis]